MSQVSSPANGRALVALPAKGALLCVIALSAGGSLGTWHRYLELTSHFKVHYLLASAACALLLILSGRRRWALLALACLLLNAAHVLPLYVPAPAAGEAGARRQRVSLLLANVNAHNPDYARLLRLARAESPDIVVLQEATHGWAAATAALRDSMPHAHTEPRHDTFGLLVYSRFPLERVETVHLGAARVPAIVARVRAGGAAFSLVTAHVYPPLAGWYEGRNEQLEDLASLASRAPRPVLLAGDLNVSPWSPYFTKFERAAGLTNARRGFGVLPTWPAYRPAMYVPIDHCLVSPEIRVTRFSTGTQIGSDHLPVVVTLEIPEPARED
jgi:endonuclease/exonuclease/phosphatase (EEP) superfamily protein YafD